MKIGDKRLLFLADRLLEIPIYEIDGKPVSNNRKLDKFCFTEFYEKSENKTCGCGLGECPGLFKEWKFFESLTITKFPCIPGFEHSFDSTGDSAREFFKINRPDFKHLFMIGFQLTEKTTAEDMAFNIINFVENRVFG